MGAVVDELLRLTTEQYQVLAGLKDNPRVIIRGSAGTGKTVLAVEEAERLARDGRRVLLTCFNRRLAQYLSTVIPSNDRITVRHLHGLMADVVSAAGLSDRLPDAQEADLFGVFYPDLCLEALLEGRADSRYDAIVADEGQDLALCAYVDVLDALLEEGLDHGTWRFFLDPHQNIFGGTNPEGLRRLLATQPAQYRLTLNCRNTIAIATATSLLSGVGPDVVLKAAGPEVEYVWFENQAQQRHGVSKWVRRLLAGGLRAGDIVILSSRRLERSCLADGLISVEVPLVDLTNARGDPGDSLGFSTIGTFKGLEADAIALIDIENLDRPESRGQVYVGASRARALLAVFLPEHEREAFDELAFQLGRKTVEPDVRA